MEIKAACHSAVGCTMGGLCSVAPPHGATWPPARSSCMFAGPPSRCWPHLGLWKRGMPSLQQLWSYGHLTKQQDSQAHLAKHLGHRLQTLQQFGMLSAEQSYFDSDFNFNVFFFCDQLNGDGSVQDHCGAVTLLQWLSNFLSGDPIKSICEVSRPPTHFDRIL